MAKVGPQGVKGQEDKGREKSEHWPLSRKAHSFTPHSHGGCTANEREFSSCSWPQLGCHQQAFPPTPQPVPSTAGVPVSSQVPPVPSGMLLK